MYRRSYLPPLARPLCLIGLLLTSCGQTGTIRDSSGGAGGDAPMASTSSGAGGSGEGGEGGAREAKPLAIVNWNTKNFFDTKVAGPDDTVLSAFDYQKKRKTIGAALKALDADIAMLCEIENLGILDDLNQSELGASYGTRVLVDGNDPRGIDIGVLSKVPFDKVVSHKEDRFTRVGTNGPSYRYARDCLELHLTYNGRKVILLGVHFKAKTPPDDLDKRLAEAQHTRKIADGLQKQDPKALIVVLGDYNDVPESPPYDAVEGKAPIVFTNAADFAPESMRYSYVFQGQNELIDHQMSSPAMKALLDPTSVVIMHGNGFDDGSKYASDHAPIKAIYQIQ